MMYKIILYFIICFNLFSQSLTIEGQEVDKKLLKLYLLEKYELLKEDISIENVIDSNNINIPKIVLLNDELVESSGVYSEIVIEELSLKNKSYLINETNVKKYKETGEVFAKFESPSGSVPYLWRDNQREIYYVNGVELLSDKNLQIVFDEFLKRIIIKDLKNKEIKVVDTTPKTQDISKVTNKVLLVFFLGVVVLLFFLGKSVKKGYGDPFKGEK